jgi:hypothetical protein
MTQSNRSIEEIRTWGDALKRKAVFLEARNWAECYCCARVHQLSKVGIEDSMVAAGNEALPKGQRRPDPRFLDRWQDLENGIPAGRSWSEFTLFCLPCHEATSTRGNCRH